MENNTVNGKKIGKGAPQSSNTAINCLSVAERKKEIGQNISQTFAELENEWNLEAKGKLHKSVVQTLKNKEDYLVFKTKDHIAYVEKGKVIKREDIQKDAKSMEQSELGD